MSETTGKEAGVSEDLKPEDLTDKAVAWDAICEKNRQIKALQQRCQELEGERERGRQEGFAEAQEMAADLCEHTGIDPDPDHAGALVAKQCANGIRTLQPPRDEDK